MSGITVAEAQLQLDLWLAASRALATGKSYQIGTRTLTRANWAEVKDAIKYFQGLVDQGGSAGTKIPRKTYRVLVRDI